MFPDFSFYSLGDPTDVFQKAWFYVGLISQIVICIGYFLFFRKVPSQKSISFSHFQNLILISRNNWRNHNFKILSASETIFRIFDAIIIICPVLLVWGYEGGMWACVSWAFVIELSYSFQSFEERRGLSFLRYSFFYVVALLCWSVGVLCGGCLWTHGFIGYLGDTLFARAVNSMSLCIRLV